MKSLNEYSTKELHEELLMREGVSQVEISLENKLFIRDSFGEITAVEGPARVLINVD
jgi:hypothetical protein